MSGSGRDNDSSRPIDSLDSFEQVEANMNSPSDGEYEPDLPFEVIPPDFQPIQTGFSQDDFEDPGIREDGLTAESLGGDVIQFDDENETSGLLNDSELLNHREHQYDSGSSCPSEDLFHNDGNHLGEGSSTDLMRYMEATPRADTSLPDLNYASDGRNDESFGYSDDVLDHREHFQNNNEEQYFEGFPPKKSDQSKHFRDRNMSNGISNGETRTEVDSDDPCDEDSTEFSNTVVAANSLRGVGGYPVIADEENYRDGPPDSKDSDSASMSIGQFVPNAVNRNHIPRRVGKPMKRSTLKTNEVEFHPPNLNGSKQGTTESRSTRSSDRNSSRASATGSHRSRNSSRYSHQSEYLSDEAKPDASGDGQRPNRVPHLNLQRDSMTSSVTHSLSSDPSRLDLSLRLQAESKTRQQADELVEQLQKNYDELLGKYAQAENTIDQLKLGARVNLYGDSPAPGQSFPGTLSPSQKPGVFNFSQPQKATVHHVLSSGSHMTGSQTGGMPSNQTGHSSLGLQANSNNIQGPAGTRPTEPARTSDSGFPAREGKLMALAFQVKSQQEQIDSFGALLQENQLAPSEQKTVLDRLRADQGKLEADYMQAKEESNALRRRNSILSGGAEVNFDPDRQLEGEIFQLGMKLEDVADIVQSNLRNNPPAALPPPHVNPPEELTNREEELQERLKLDLESHFQNSRQASDRTSERGEGNQPDAPGLEYDSPHLPYHSGNSVSPSELSDKGSQSQIDAPSLFSPPQPSRPQENGKQRSSRNMNATDVELGQRRPKQSQLPRPKSLSATDKSPHHDTRQHHPADGGQAPRHKPPTNGFVSPEADSGFMGSESSRQSNQNGGPSGYNGQNQLRKLRERQNPRSGKLPLGLRFPPQVQRHLAGDQGSPQFSDYDISEQDEDIEDGSMRSGGFGTQKPGTVEKTPVAKNASKEHRRLVDKPNQRAMTAPSDRLQPSGLRHPAERPQREREQQRAVERQQSPERRGAGTKSAKAPNRSWSDHRDGPTGYPEPTSNHRQLPKQGPQAPYSRRNNPKDDTRLEVDPERRNRVKGLVDVLRQRPQTDPRQQRMFDSGSEVTRSSGKSEAIWGLQDEIERLKRQMAKMNSPKKTLRRSPPEEPHRQRSSQRRDRLASVNSEAESSRSEILSALQNEIDELRNQVNERDASPPLYGSPLSRSSLREPLRDDHRGGSLLNSPPPRDRLRETLRQSYIPQRAPSDPSFTRTPTRSFLPSRSPHLSRTLNPVPVFESTPFVSRPPYIPDAATFPESPSARGRSHLPSSFPSSQLRRPPDSGVTLSPVYTTRVEPCPLCSGSGVHTHGEYSYPGDLQQRNSAEHPQGAADFGRRQTQPVSSPAPLQGHMQAGMSTPQNQVPLSNPREQLIFNPSQQSAQGQQSVFTPQSLLNQPQAQPQQVFSQPQPTVNQPQPVSQPQQLYHQPQPMSNQPQSVSNQPQPLVNQPQPLVNQPQSVVNQPQSVSNQPQPLMNQPQPLVNQPQPVSANPQPVSNQTAQTPFHASAQTPAQTLYAPVASYVPLVTVPLYTGVPLSATPQGTSGKQTKDKSEKKPKKSRDTQKSARGAQDTGGTTIYITPTKRRGRYYVLDDDEEEEDVDSTYMEEEYYYRRKPRVGSTNKVSSLTRKANDFKYASSPSIDLKDAIKMADHLSRSSHRMLESVRNDVSQSHFF